MPPTTLREISIVAFSQSACAELLRLDDGDAVSVQGLIKIDKYEKNGETKVSLSVTADLVTAFRQSSKRKEPKSPTARQLGFRPIWALGSSGSIGTPLVLPGVEAITLLAENDEASQRAINQCAVRWHAANREVTVIDPLRGSEINDAIRETTHG